MSPRIKKPRTARRDTDASLRVERKRTDDERSDRRVSVEEDSDAVVHQARARADEVLGAARDHADEALEGDHAAASSPAEVNRARDEADRVLQEARSAADARLATERDERASALAELLRLERESTDQHLLIERARSDEELVTRDDFMAMVAHDLRSLLGGIALNAAMIVRAGARDADESTLRRVEGIQRSTARMNRLLGDLADVSSIEAGRFMVAPEVGDATRLVRESVEAFQPSASAKGVTLGAEVAEDPLRASFDHDRVLQVLANLLSNAIKFTPKGGRVSLRLDRSDGKARFAVSDTGPGIDAAKHEKVFMRFWQGQKGDPRGMGLGLYISKRIVEEHGGRIWVESTPGRGSTFCFTLPTA